LGGSCPVKSKDLSQCRKKPLMLCSTPIERQLIVAGLYLRSYLLLPLCYLSSFCNNVDTADFRTATRAFCLCAICSACIKATRSFCFCALCSACIKAGEFQWRFSLPLELACEGPTFYTTIKIADYYKLIASCSLLQRVMFQH